MGFKAFWRQCGRIYKTYVITTKKLTVSIPCWTTMTAFPPPIAPLTGTLRYPLNELLSLAKTIIKDVQTHHRAIADSADAADDDTTLADEWANLVDINSALFQVEPPPSQDDDTEVYRRWVEDPRSPERGLLRLGFVMKIDWV